MWKIRIISSMLSKILILRASQGFETVTKERRKKDVIVPALAQVVSNNSSKEEVTVPMQAIQGSQGVFHS